MSYLSVTVLVLPVCCCVSVTCYCVSVTRLSVAVLVLPVYLLLCYVYVFVMGSCGKFPVTKQASKILAHQCFLKSIFDPSNLPMKDHSNFFTPAPHPHNNLHYHGEADTQ